MTALSLQTGRSNSLTTEVVSKREGRAAATTVLVMDILGQHELATFASQKRGIQALIAAMSGAIPRIFIARFML